MPSSKRKKSSSLRHRRVPSRKSRSRRTSVVCNINKLKRKECCCGATLKYPCLCMIKGVKKCSKNCPCFTLLRMQKNYKKKSKNKIKSKIR